MKSPRKAVNEYRRQNEIDEMHRIRITLQRRGRINVITQKWESLTPRTEARYLGRLAELEARNPEEQTA